MRRRIEDIEIKEPPIQELSKKRSCYKRSCLTGCGCVIVLLIASLLLLKFAAGPRIKELKNLPANFPKSMPVYDKDNIKSIIFISGKERSRGLEMAAMVPKFILSPIVLMWERQMDADKTENNNWKNFIKLMREPVSDNRDIVEIEWEKLNAEPRFVQQYYETELKKSGYSVKNIQDTDSAKQLSFKKEKTEGVLYIKDVFEDPGTDYTHLTINIPQ